LSAGAFVYVNDGFERAGGFGRKTSHSAPFSSSLSMQSVGVDVGTARTPGTAATTYS
jgi:hypothetical protein